MKSILIAVIDRIIPADDFPSASQAGVMNYLARQFVGDAQQWAEPIETGLESLDAQARQKSACGFAELPAEKQDELLASIESERFFEELVALTSEGFYADTGNGGNFGEISWKMIGYLPREKGDLE